MSNKWRGSTSINRRIVGKNLGSYLSSLQKVSIKWDQDWWCPIKAVLHGVICLLKALLHGAVSLQLAMQFYAEICKHEPFNCESTAEFRHKSNISLINITQKQNCIASCKEIAPCKRTLRSSHSRL